MPTPDGYDDGKNLDNSEDVVLVMNQKSQEKIPTERINRKAP